MRLNAAGLAPTRGRNRLAVSVIAWPPEADAWAANTLPSVGIEGIEVAPARVCHDPSAATQPEIDACRGFWERHGLPIVAMQALLFGRPDLTIFDGIDTRNRTLAYLSAIIDLAAGLGAGRLVFGSPRNRRRGGRTVAEAFDRAIPFFRELGRRAAEKGVVLCIEPNPVEYGCDFLVDSTEAADFVAAVGHPGFGLHLDSGGMTLAGERPGPTLAAAPPSWKHFHASEPHLVPLGDGGVDHAAMGAALRSTAYEGWVSIEMAQAATGEAWQERLLASIAIARTAYLEAGTTDGPPAHGAVG